MRLVKLYRACLDNAENLLSEACLLFEHAHYARAYVLAHTAWEEIGKSQIVADYAHDMVSKQEFEAAFKDHKLKSAYNWRQFELNPDDLPNSTITYDRSRAEATYGKRQQALYVEKASDYEPIEPKNEVPAQNAEVAIKAVKGKLSEIRKAGYLSERIGSKSFLK